MSITSRSTRLRRLVAGSVFVAVTIATSTGGADAQIRAAEPPGTSPSFRVQESDNNEELSLPYLQGIAVYLQVRQKCMEMPFPVSDCPLRPGSGG